MTRYSQNNKPITNSPSKIRGGKGALILQENWKQWPLMLQKDITQATLMPNSQWYV